MVDGGLTGIPVTSRDHVWHKFPALILTSNGHLSKMPPSIATKGRGKMTSTHKLSNADVHSGGTSAPQVSTNKINPHPGDLSFIDVPGSINTFWLSINNWGEIAGVEGINDAGVIVGEAAFGTHQIGFCTIPVPTILSLSVSADFMIRGTCWVDFNMTCGACCLPIHDSQWAQTLH